MAFSAANQSACGDPSGLLFPSAVREFLDQFMTILSIKIGQWPGPLRQWLDLCCHMHTPYVFARFTLKSVIRFDSADCLQGAAFVALRQARYEIARTASTICLAEIPKASTSSSDVPECGMSRTAMICDVAGATLACARADRTASPIPPSAQ
jgi:hypothetical protein